MKLNMGCGNSKAKGFINVDMSPVCEPDQIVDLEVLPWPWPDNSVEEVLFNHCLEHLGRDPRVFLSMFKELYRVCVSDALVRINVPHPRHDNFINDPTHVRAITPALLVLFSRKENDRWKACGAANTPLAHYLDVDFELVSHEIEIEEPYRTQIQQGLLSEDDWRFALREKNNFASEFRIVIRAKKQPALPGAGPLSTAFLFEPVWSDSDWKEVLLSYLEAFKPGEPVALVFPLDGTLALQVAESRVMDVVLASGRDVFPDLILVDHTESLVDTLRRFPSIQWVSGNLDGLGQLSGPLGQRFASTRRRLGSI